MNPDGQIYFAPEDEIPVEDRERMSSAQQMELARRAQADQDAKLIKELQDALGSPE